MSRLKKWLIGMSIAIPLFFFLTDIVRSLNGVSNLAILEDNFSLAIEYSYLEDKANIYSPYNIEQVLNQFTKAELNKGEVGFGEQSYWHHIKLTKTLNQSQPLVMFLDNPMIDEMHVYHYQRGFKQLAHLGDHNQNQSLESMAFPSVAIELAPGQTKSLLIRTKTLGAASLPIAFFTDEDFKRYKDAIYLLWGAMIGIVILMCAYNLILFFGVSEKLYLLYVGYIITFLLELGIVHGYNVYLMPISVHQLLSSNIISLNYLVAYFTLLFALHFLRLHNQDHLKKVKFAKFMANLYLFGAVISLTLVEYQAAQIFFTTQPVLYLSAALLIYHRLKEGAGWVNYYLISWFPLFVGAAVGPFLLTGNLDYDFWTRHALFLGVAFEMTFISMALAERLRTSEKERLYQASHDHMFGFANLALLENASAKQMEEQNQQFSVVVVSIAKYDSIVPYIPKAKLKDIIFQFVNDVERELANDLLLVEVDKHSEYKNTAMIREGVFGFVVSSNDHHLIKNVLKKFANKQPINYQAADLAINLTSYIGAAAHSEKVGSTNELVNRAQQAIELAATKNKLYGIYNEKSDSHDRRKVKLASDLQLALENGELMLFHQPQINAKTKSLIGSEVLLRWHHASYGFIPPDEFVQIAEDTGIINKLSEWVFIESCHHLISLKKLNIKVPRISVNVSVHDVMYDGFIAFLVRTIDKFGLKAEMFMLELTETVSVNDTDKFNRNMLELKDIGFLLAIDDFGTGYSSLTYVSKHPFDELKIDREFIRFLEHSNKDQTIVSATINMAKSLNLKVVAEGVEDEATLSMLSGLQCDAVQGYHIARPMDFDSYLEWLDDEQIKQSFSNVS